MSDSRFDHSRAPVQHRSDLSPELQHRLPVRGIYVQDIHAGCRVEVIVDLGAGTICWEPQQSRSDKENSEVLLEPAARRRLVELAVSVWRTPSHRKVEIELGVRQELVILDGSAVSIEHVALGCFEPDSRAAKMIECCLELVRPCQG